MYTFSPQRTNGFIALISIVMISVILLGATLSLAQFGLANRYFILDLEHKNISEKLAEACIHAARIYIYNDPEFNPSSMMLPIGDATCTIHAVIPHTPHSGESTVTVQAMSGSAVTNIQVVIEASSGNFLSWTELPHL